MGIVRGDDRGQFLVDGQQALGQRRLPGVRITPPANMRTTGPVSINTVAGRVRAGIDTQNDHGHRLPGPGETRQADPSEFFLDLRHQVVVDVEIGRDLGHVVQIVHGVIRRISVMASLPSTLDRSCSAPGPVRWR